MRSVRVWFKKTGTAIYISHLDMNRCLSRAVVRAKIPLWYTEGFNPKPYLNFLCPLPLGQEGLNEPLDIRIEGEMTNEEVRNALSSVMPEGIEIKSVTDPVMKTAQITSAEYEITLETGCENTAADFALKAGEIIKSGELVAEKRSKKGVKTVNLCEMILSFSAVADGAFIRIKTVTATGSASNLNPDLVLTALFEKTGFEPVSRKISRTKLFNESGEEFR
ncbi:MAG: DUF2344 domain-containing protein [Clostridia bacterium]|nr:DUF2344 domain-containing protein [Clostridia bacterium]